MGHAMLECSRHLCTQSTSPLLGTTPMIGLCTNNVLECKVIQITQYMEPLPWSSYGADVGTLEVSAWLGHELWASFLQTISGRCLGHFPDHHGLVFTLDDD